MASDAAGTSDMDGIERADAVESIRNQLIDAAGRATGRPVAFEVGDIQMEFTLELRKEIKGGAKVKARVVDAGADASRTTGRTHKVAFTLNRAMPRPASPIGSATRTRAARRTSAAGRRSHEQYAAHGSRVADGAYGRRPRLRGRPGQRRPAHRPSRTDLRPYGEGRHI